MNTHKIILAIFAVTQLTSYQAYGSDVTTSSISIDQNSQIETLLETLEDIKAKTLTNWDMLITKNKDGNWAYPEMHWVAFCDEIINLFNTVGKDLPENIRLKVIEVVNLKRNSKDGFYTQINSKQVLISDTLVLLIETLLQQLYTSTPDILKLGVTQDDIKKIKNELDNNKKRILEKKRHGNYYSLDSAFEDIKKIGNKLKPILLKNPIYVEKIKRKLDLQDNTATKNDLTLAEKTALIILLNARIEQSKNL